MSKFDYQLREFLATLRKSLGLDNNRPSQFGLNFWNSPSRLAQSPNGLRPHPQRRLDDYSRGANPTRPHKYTQHEVKLMLRGLEKSVWAQPVLVQAATINMLLDARMIRHFRGRERMFERLHYVLFQYTQGKPTLEIARSVSYFSDGDDVEDAINFAAHLIANHLNRQR